MQNIDDVFQKLSYEKNIEVPKYLQNLLKLAGCNSVEITARLNVASFEHEAKRILFMIRSPQSYLPKVNGIKCEVVEDFLIIPGHKIILLMVVEECQKIISEQDK